MMAQIHLIVDSVVAVLRNDYLEKHPSENDAQQDEESSSSAKKDN